jgi:pyruvate kinase
MDHELAHLRTQLRALRRATVDLEERSARALGEVSPEQRVSARNLVHYLALRQKDLRDLQDRLASVGLSSLGRAEPSVAASLDAVLHLLGRLAGEAGSFKPEYSLADGRNRLARNAEALLGEASRGVRILVTLPSEAAEQPQLLEDLLVAGMDAARINCAHDDRAAWERMLVHLHAAEERTGRRCRVLMDLAGPKLRTGELAPGPEVVKIRPRRSPLGGVVRPARIWLRPTDDLAAAPRHDAMLPLPRAFLERLAVGDRLELQDARGARRSFEVVGEHGAGRVALSWKTCYVTSGMEIHHGRRVAHVGRLPVVPIPVIVKPGDTLVLSRTGRVPCTLPEVFRDVKPGEQIWINDGKIGGRIVGADENELRIEITLAKPEGSKIRSDKGINLPDTQIRLPALDEKDRRDLEFICRHADLVGLSFIRRPADVAALQAELARLGRPDLGVVLKIETRQAFEQLPAILLQAMRGAPFGVMIARGDLAVECGWERLAEVQEEILWICEAAHVPVIWATQVLERLANTGLPTRAEITDAAMGERAECVMLNKGPHVRQAVEALADILRRMQAHQAKKRPMMRPLSLAARFAAGASAS